jgi:hypothetical protein
MHISIFNKYFYRNNKSKLHFEDRVAVLNDMFYEYGRSMRIKISLWPNVTIHSTEYLKFSTIHFTMGAICIVHIW